LCVKNPFRQLFVEFADESDIRRVEKAAAAAAARQRGDTGGRTAEEPTRALLQAVKEHREVCPLTVAPAGAIGRSRHRSVTKYGRSTARSCRPSMGPSAGYLPFVRLFSFQA